MEKLRAALSVLQPAFAEPPGLQELLALVRAAFLRGLPAREAQVFLRESGEGSGFLLVGEAGARRVPGLGGLVEEAFSGRKPIAVNEPESDPRLLFAGDQTLRSGVKSALSVPISGKTGASLGAVELVNPEAGRYSALDIERAQVLAGLAGLAVEQFQGLDLLRNLNVALQEQTLPAQPLVEDYLLESRNPQLVYVRERIRHYAEADAAVLVEGESGTGKEGIARLLHSFSKRASGPLVVVNCAAIPETLFEAELFGAAKGAATGVSARKGKIELAHKGTLVLDEIGELPLSMQPKLLRALQEKRITPLGSDLEPRAIDFRLVCSTNRDLAELVRKGTFREDLFFRINVVTISLPPLRERTGDIPALSRLTLAQLCQQYRLPPKTLSAAAVEYLQAQEWPGNIRQLRNRVESALIASRGRDVIALDDFVELGPARKKIQKKSSASGSEVIPLREAKLRAERQAIEAALGQTKGNRAAAAKLLGITREGLRLAMRKATRP